MRIYITGAISRYKGQFDRVRDEFQILEDILASRGFEVFNPWKILPYDPDYTWLEYMQEDIPALINCDAVLLRSDWIFSRGARIEYIIAKLLHIPIVTEKNVYKVHKLLTKKR